MTDWEALGISRTWYHLVTTRQRNPSLSLALRIYDELGERYGILEKLSPEEVEKLR